MGRAMAPFEQDPTSAAGIKQWHGLDIKKRHAQAAAKRDLWDPQDGDGDYYGDDQEYYGDGNQGLSTSTTWLPATGVTASSVSLAKSCCDRYQC
jgi:hypothetical protein